MARGLRTGGCSSPFGAITKQFPSRSEEHVCVLFPCQKVAFYSLLLPDTPLLQYFCAMLKKPVLPTDVPK